jgi:hypothetical protein
MVAAHLAVPAHENWGLILLLPLAANHQTRAASLAEMLHKIAAFRRDRQEHGR